MEKSFEKPRIEYSQERDEQQEKNIEKVFGFLGKVAERLRGRGVPVKDDCRPDMGAYKHIYSEDVIKKDKKSVEEEEEKHAKKRGIKKEAIEEEKKKTTGEQLEVLAVAILNKVLPERFIAIRSSLFDDFSREHKVDIVLLDKETGSVVCAFDDVSDTEGPLFKKKKAEVMERNKKGGARIKYALGMKDKELILCSQEYVPIFYLALSERSIKNGMKEFKDSFDEISDYEKEAFDLFVQEIGNQFAELGKKEKMHHKVRTNAIKFYEKVLPVLQNIDYNLKTKK